MENCITRNEQEKVSGFSKDRSDKSTLGKDLLVTLMHYDPSDPGSLILVTFRNLFLMGPLGLVRFVQ